MVAVEDYILGNGALHERFFATTEILGKLVSSAPRAVSLTQLEAETGRSGKELTKLCAGLERAGLLRRESAADKWTLTCCPAAVTLEDVFRCVLSQQPARAKPIARAANHERGASDVDLLVMQAMITVNQSVFKHLRQFSLDRLKASAAGMFPSTARSLPARSAGMDTDFDLPVSGREARSVSPA